MTDVWGALQLLLWQAFIFACGGIGIWCLVSFVARYLDQHFWTKP